MQEMLEHAAPSPARGSFAAGFAPVAKQFAEQLSSGKEVGAAFSVYHHGERVVDLWGGQADPVWRRPWQRNTRIVVFSVTKGFAAMGMNLLADRGQLEWDRPVADYWPGFARNGKGDITVRALLNHQAGLPYLTTPLVLADFTSEERASVVLSALESQRPIWPPGQSQGYHAMTFGMYASELFQRVAGESLGVFLRRELFEPLGSDVHLGTPVRQDAKCATLIAPSNVERVSNMVSAAVKTPRSNEARIFRAVLGRNSIARRAFANPSTGPSGVLAYNERDVRRAELAWASATASADGVARAYLPFAQGGEHDGRRYLREETLAPLYERQGWADRDDVLQKPLGWSGGFLKEETRMFSPNRESFGHPGMGGALGWADPVAALSFGYVMNRMDWRVRSPRAVSLCHALYSCEPVGAG